MERVVLVDEADRAVGFEEKVAAHVAGYLHRAFSVFVFDRSRRLLLQRRAPGKYHSGGRWSNTCCGHPRPGESVEEAAHRRLREEMGFDCPLVKIATYRYTARVGDGLVENELDHLLAGEFEGAPAPDPSEATEWRWADPAAVLREATIAPQRFTAWLRGSLEQVLTAAQVAPTARAAPE
jgi:isopentenyl-diphosphate delta-isomerase